MSFDSASKWSRRWKRRSRNDKFERYPALKTNSRRSNITKPRNLKNWINWKARLERNLISAASSVLVSTFYISQLPSIVHSKTPSQLYILTFRIERLYYDQQTGPFHPARLIVHVNGDWSLWYPSYKHIVVKWGWQAYMHDSYGSWHLYICRSLFRLSTFLLLHSCLWRAPHVLL